MVDTGKSRKNLILHLADSLDMIRNNHFYNHSKQAIKLTHFKGKFRMKTQIYSSKKCPLHSENMYYSNYILPVFRTNFLKLIFWKLVSNYLATLNLENVNLLSKPNVNPKNGVAYKKNV